MGWWRLQLRANLPKMVDAVTSAGQVVTWVCDPMHGNTECVAGYKTRRYDNIRAEVGALPLWVVSVCQVSATSVRVQRGGTYA